MRLRIMRTQDVDGVVVVQERGAVAGLGHIFPQDTHPFPRETVAERWRSEIADPQIQAWVATDTAGTIIGFAAVRGSELLHFGTALDSWGTSTAADLHKKVLAAVAGEADGPVELWLRVFEANVRARRFYERLGWTATSFRTRTSFAPYPVLVQYRRLVEKRRSGPVDG